jgi:hypothetical protein
MSKTNVGWSIKNLDTGELHLPPYPIDGPVHISIGGEVVDQTRFGMQEAISQWVGGRAREITFTTTLFAENADVDISWWFDDYVKLAEEDPALGRPPICVWTLGSWMQEMCTFVSVDAQVYQRDDGKPLRVDLSFSLRRYAPFSQVQVDPTKRPKESYYLVVTRAEASYEALAKRFYGQPLLGDRLRKRNPAEPMSPAAGSKISIPPKSTILKERVKPEFHALDLSNAEALDNFERVLELRSMRKAVILE